MTGCDNQQKLKQHLADYQLRMAKVLKLEPPSIEPITLPNYPHSNTLQQATSDNTIKLFEFYQLKHCELYTLIAERNTTLGRLQLPSTRYLYEKKLVLALNDCLQQTDDLKLQEKLQLWLNNKTEQMPTVWADLMQLSSELKTALSSNSGLITGNNQDGIVLIKQAFDYLLKIEHETLVNSNQLEQHLKQLNNNPLPAKLWLSQLILTAHLEQSTVWLAQHQTKLNCDSAKSKQQMKYLSNVFQLFFIEKIQPIAGQLNHYHYRLSPIFNLLVNHPHLSPSYIHYIQQQQQGFKLYQAAMLEHVQYWQGLFKRCNIVPGTT
jgi:hypothetical protein